MMKLQIVTQKVIKKIVIVSAIVVLFLGYFIFKNLKQFKPLLGQNSPQIEKPNLGPKGNDLSFLKIADGFRIDVFAKDLEDPRVIAFDPKGRILVSETKAGRITILENKDGFAKSKRVLLNNLKLPQGIAFYNSPGDGKDYLYIAETNQVSRYAYNSQKGELIDNKGTNIANLPGDSNPVSPSQGGHSTRTIAFGPNYRKEAILKGLLDKESLNPTKLYISVGSSCDVCVEDTWKRAAILESDPEGNFTVEFAGGLRNSAFFTFHPVTKEMWATEIGRDNLGDNLPPDEINIVRVAGPENKFGARRFGWPFCYGNQIKDTTFKTDKIDRIDLSQDCSQTEPATIEIPAHSAPLGLAFVTNPKWPKDWQNNLLVAYHGSLNRNAPTGYKVVKFTVDKEGKVLGVEDFITGWLTKGKVFGRPVDLKFGPDGALYISDDEAGIIYRVVSK